MRPISLLTELTKGQDVGTINISRLRRLGIAAPQKSPDHQLRRFLFTIYDSLFTNCLLIGFDRSAFAARPKGAQSKRETSCGPSHHEGLLEHPIKIRKPTSTRPVLSHYCEAR